MFTQFSMYASAMVIDPRARMRKFMLAVFEMVLKDCHPAMLINYIDISHLMVHAQEIEEEKLKEDLER